MKLHASLLALAFLSAPSCKKQEMAAVQGTALQGDALEANRVFLMAHGFTHNGDSKCKLTDDPFEVGVRVFANPTPANTNPDAIEIIRVNRPGGTAPNDAGACVDNKGQRPAIQLTDAEIQYYQLQKSHPDSIFVANVRDTDGFHLAEIPVDSFNEMDFLIVKFQMPMVGVKGGHSQLRARLAPGKTMKLYSQWPFTGKVQREVSEVFFSINGFGKDGNSLSDIADSWDGSWVLGLTVNTPESRIQSDFSTSAKATVAQYRLDFTTEQRNAFAREYIRRSTSWMLGRHFFLTETNCNTELFRIFQTITGSSHTVANPLIPAIVDDTVFPDRALGALLSWKLVKSAAENDIGPLEKEPAVRAFLEQRGLTANMLNP